MICRISDGPTPGEMEFFGNPQQHLTTAKAPLCESAVFHGLTEQTRLLRCNNKAGTTLLHHFSIWELR